MKLGIYGGTFAPIHNAHVRVARAFLEDLRLDRVLIIPAGIPPHKQVGKDDAPEMRLTMCQLAFEGIDDIEVSDIELKREGKSYTVLTVRELWNEDTELYLLCGSDMILSFDRWYLFEEIFSRCTIVYVRRENDDEIGREIENKINEYRAKYGAKVVGLDTNTLELSSTEIRAAVKEGKDVSSLVPEKVSKYIKSNRLYLED